MTNQIDVIVLSSSDFIRKSIINVLSRDEHIRKTSEASNKSDLLENLYEFNDAIAIIHDQAQRNISTAEALKLIGQEGQNVKSILLIDDYDSDRELSALKMGAYGYLTENKITTDLVKALKAIHSGKMWARKAIMGEYIQQIFVKIQKGEYLSPSLNQFNKKELQVMVFVSKNMKNKDIAKKLNVSESTVKHYISRIFKKLNIHKRTDIKDFI